MIDPFAYHKPSEEEIGRIEEIRKAYLHCLQEVTRLTRPGSVSGRYVALARTELESSAMFCTKSVVFERDNTDPQGEQKP